MSAEQAVQGLACPRCGGMIPIPEGQIIVRCPYCDLRSMVNGERGVQRFQVPQRISRDQAGGALRAFLGSSMAIARDAARTGRIEDIFLVHLPFWSHRARVLGWVFGQEKVGSGKNSRYVARERRVAEEMYWDGAACDVSEFGVNSVNLAGKPLEPFEPDKLHDSGMVFEPVGSASDARKEAGESFTTRTQSKASLDRVSQLFVRFTNWFSSLVYYPLWVLRYNYHGRTFQVVVDGLNGQVLYGKAPSSVFFRAARLVLGVAFGAVISIDGSALAFTAAINTNSDDAMGLLLLGLGALIGGFVLMFNSYRAYRFGEHYEFRLPGSKNSSAVSKKSALSTIEEITSWLDR